MRRFLCMIFGHWPRRFRHPQQEGSECECCKYIIDRAGKVIAPPLTLTAGKSSE